MAKPLHVEDANLYVTHLNWATRWRIPHFRDLSLGKACLEAIEHERARIGLVVIAFALLPDHFHLIAAPAPMPLGALVQALKAASVLRLKAQGLVTGGLWQNGYFDVAIHDERQLRATIDYVHDNPAKAGLVSDPRLYPLSSYGAWEGQFESPISLAGANEFLTF